MPASEQVLMVVRGWIEKAENDLKTAIRYPGDYEPVSLGEARHAVALARRIRVAVRRELPKETLRRRSR